MAKKKVNIIEEGLEEGESPIVKKLYDKFEKDIEEHPECISLI